MPCPECVEAEDGVLVPVLRQADRRPLRELVERYNELVELARQRRAPVPMGEATPGVDYAYHFDAGFVPVRKAGKLPSSTTSESYELEYGKATLEIHTDGVTPGERVLIVDDEAGILETLQILLRNEGFEPHVAAGGKAGLEQIEALSLPELEKKLLNPRSVVPGFVA